MKRLLLLCLIAFGFLCGALPAQDFTLHMPKRHRVIHRPKPVTHEVPLPGGARFDATCPADWVADTAPLDVYPDPSVKQVRKAFRRMICRKPSLAESEIRTEIGLNKNDHVLKGWQTSWDDPRPTYDVIYTVIGSPVPKGKR